MYELNDDSLMPYGKYEGYNMINVPASYLLYLYDNNKCSGVVLKYIKDNLEFIKKGA